MSIHEEGIEGEQWLLGFLRKKGIPCFQADAISFEDDNYVVNEVKNQEFFKAPPFDGHGLPPGQVRARMIFFEKTGIRPKLIIREKGTDIVYWQWLDVLEKGSYIDTKGLKQRRIYPLENFNKLI